MILKDFHVHSVFCDGKSTIEETVLAAMEKGMHTVGFSGHSHTPFDADYCMSPAQTEEYIAEVNRVKNKYFDKIKVFCGIELDAFSDTDTSPFDYVIGSAHYIFVNGEYIPVDLSPQALINAADKHFGGNMYGVVKEYYKTVCLLASKKIDIIGHIDLITKFNENSVLFDEKTDLYREYYTSAVSRLLELNVPFEINTGVIVRGYKTVPYPAEEIISFIANRGGSFLLSSDSHAAHMLCFEFEKWKAYADSLGVKWSNFAE